MRAFSLPIISSRPEQMMVIEYVRYKIPADQADQFIAAYATAGEVLRKSSHCLGFELSRCTEEPTSFILRIEWDSVEGHMEGFRKSPEFREFFASVRPFVGQLEEMRHYGRTVVQALRR
jgi:quinol monooxygenase YgiN